MTTPAGGTVIELLGPPAVGKSTLAGLLGERPDTVLVKDHRLGDGPVLLGATARTALGSRRVLAAPLPPGVGRARWVAWAGRLAAAPQVAGRRVAAGHSTVVLDQGPAYTLGRMAGLRSSPSGERWWQARAWRTAGLLDLLVLLDADPDTLGARLRNRDKAHRAGGLAEPAASGYLSRERALCRRVADALAGHGTTVLVLDTATTTPRLQLAAVLARLAPAGLAGGRR